MGEVMQGQLPFKPLHCVNAISFRTTTNPVCRVIENYPVKTLNIRWIRRSYFLNFAQSHVCLQLAENISKCASRRRNLFFPSITTTRPFLPCCLNLSFPRS
ncbi:hypothetical protein PS726_05731 [Pseudomonas fluorescens]|nr:hypothetical protein PS726_05731 [Pseudomonas fluorescens]